MLIIGFSSCTKQLKRSNIIYILADDLGFGEMGVYGQKIIETPQIDTLARNGMMFTQHYSGSPVCAPSRAVLLTGQHTGAHTLSPPTFGKRTLPSRNTKVQISSIM